MTVISFPSVRLYPHTQTSIEERRLRRVEWAWALLFFNVLSFTTFPKSVLPIPNKVGQLLTQGALGAAFLVVVSLNPKAKIRPSVFLFLYSVLGAITFMMSIRFVGLGTTYRATRLLGFLAVLWLLTPWWGRRDLLLLRAQLRFLVMVLVSILLGILLSPHTAFQFAAGASRLSGVLWPMPATQVGHYMAELTGLTVLLWLCGMIKRRPALMILVPSLATLLLTQTRTALLGMVVALLVAGLSLFTGSRRARKLFAVGGLVMVLVVLPLSPVLANYLVRGESTTEVSNLSGRTEVWPAVLSEPRPEINKLLGSGMSNGSVVGALDPRFDGLPVDDSWISTYQNQGLVGDILEGAIFLLLLLTASFRPSGPTRAMALFLIVYCLVASFTETGMGDASTYLLDITVAASLLALPSGLGNVTWLPLTRHRTTLERKAVL